MHTDSNTRELNNISLLSVEDTIDLKILKEGHPISLDKEFDKHVLGEIIKNSLNLSFLNNIKNDAFFSLEWDVEKELKNRNSEEYKSFFRDCTNGLDIKSKDYLDRLSNLENHSVYLKDYGISINVTVDKSDINNIKSDVSIYNVILDNDNKLQAVAGGSINNFIKDFIKDNDLNKYKDKFPDINTLDYQLNVLNSILKSVDPVLDVKNIFELVVSNDVITECINVKENTNILHIPDLFRKEIKNNILIQERDRQFEKLARKNPMIRLKEPRVNETGLDNIKFLRTKGLNLPEDLSKDFDLQRVLDVHDLSVLLGLKNIGTSIYNKDDNISLLNDQNEEIALKLNFNVSDNDNNRKKYDDVTLKISDIILDNFENIPDFARRETLDKIKHITRIMRHSKHDLESINKSQKLLFFINNITNIDSLSKQNLLKDDELNSIFDSIIDFSLSERSQNVQSYLNQGMKYNGTDIKVCSALKIYFANSLSPELKLEFIKKCIDYQTNDRQLDMLDFLIASFTLQPNKGLEIYRISRKIENYQFKNILERTQKFENELQNISGTTLHNPLNTILQGSNQKYIDYIQEKFEELSPIVRKQILENLTSNDKKYISSLGITKMIAIQAAEYGESFDIPENIINNHTKYYISDENSLLKSIFDKSISINVINYRLKKIDENFIEFRDHSDLYHDIFGVPSRFENESELIPLAFSEYSEELFKEYNSLYDKQFFAANLDELSKRITNFDVWDEIGSLNIDGKIENVSKVLIEAFQVLPPEERIEEMTKLVSLYNSEENLLKYLKESDLLVNYLRDNTLLNDQNLAVLDKINNSSQSSNIKNNKIKNREKGFNLYQAYRFLDTINDIQSKYNFACELNSPYHKMYFDKSIFLNNLDIDDRKINIFEMLTIAFNDIESFDRREEILHIINKDSFRKSMEEDILSSLLFIPEFKNSIIDGYANNDILDKSIPKILGNNNINLFNQRALTKDMAGFHSTEKLLYDLGYDPDNDVDNYDPDIKLDEVSKNSIRDIGLEVLKEKEQSIKNTVFSKSLQEVIYSKVQDLPLSKKLLELKTSDNHSIIDHLCKKIIDENISPEDLYVKYKQIEQMKTMTDLDFVHYLLKESEILKNIEGIKKYENFDLFLSEYMFRVPLESRIHIPSGVESYISDNFSFYNIQKTSELTFGFGKINYAHSIDTIKNNFNNDMTNILDNEKPYNIILELLSKLKFKIKYYLDQLGLRNLDDNDRSYDKTRVLTDNLLNLQSKINEILELSPQDNAIALISYKYADNDNNMLDNLVDIFNNMDIDEQKNMLEYIEDKIQYRKANITKSNESILQDIFSHSFFAADTRIQNSLNWIQSMPKEINFNISKLDKHNKVMKHNFNNMIDNNSSNAYSPKNAFIVTPIDYNMMKNNYGQTKIFNNLLEDAIKYNFGNNAKFYDDKNYSIDGNIKPYGVDNNNNIVDIDVCLQKFFDDKFGDDKPTIGSLLKYSFTKYIDNNNVDVSKHIDSFIKQDKDRLSLLGHIADDVLISHPDVVLSSFFPEIGDNISIIDNKNHFLSIENAYVSDVQEEIFHSLIHKITTIYPERFKDVFYNPNFNNGFDEHDTLNNYMTSTFKNLSSDEKRQDMLNILLEDPSAYINSDKEKLSEKFFVIASKMDIVINNDKTEDTIYMRDLQLRNSQERLSVIKQSIDKIKSDIQKQVKNVEPHGWEEVDNVDDQGNIIRKGIITDSLQEEDAYISEYYNMEQLSELGCGLIKHLPNFDNGNRQENIMTIEEIICVTLDDMFKKAELALQDHNTIDMLERLENINNNISIWSKLTNNNVDNITVLALSDTSLGIDKLFGENSLSDKVTNNIFSSILNEKGFSEKYYNKLVDNLGFVPIGKDEIKEAFKTMSIKDRIDVLSTMPLGITIPKNIYNIESTIQKPKSILKQVNEDNVNNFKLKKNLKFASEVNKKYFDNGVIFDLIYAESENFDNSIKSVKEIIFNRLSARINDKEALSNIRMKLNNKIDSSMDRRSLLIDYKRTYNKDLKQGNIIVLNDLLSSLQDDLKYFVDDIVNDLERIDVLSSLENEILEISNSTENVEQCIIESGLNTSVMNNINVTNVHDVIRNTNTNRNIYRNI